MPSSFALAYPMLRLILAALGIFFAFGLGRALASPRRRLVWVLRVAAVALGVCWRGFDWLSAAAIALMLVATGVGYYLASRPKRDEHLEDVIFPKE
jgi:hypothetical protein